MKSIGILLVIVELFLVCVNGCDFIEINADIGNFRFYPMTIQESFSVGLTSGRTSFATKAEESDNKTLFLYHVNIDGFGGIGRWVINDELGSKTNAMAFIDSWAVLPHMIREINDADKLSWQVSVSGNWIVDSSPAIFCSNQDRTIFFESSHILPQLSGFYLETMIDKEVYSHDGPVYASVKAFDDDVMHYLYKVDGKWIIGDDIGVDNGAAFMEDTNSTYAHEIDTQLWYFAVGGQWTPEYAFVVGGDSESSAFRNLHNHRYIKFIPNGQQVTRLRNDIVIPLVGLGTGGIPLESQERVVDQSIRLGYRSLDLAREYNNENVVGDLLEKYLQNKEDDGEPLVRREELFLISKVWPTHLGFLPTSNELFYSLEALRTSYVDLYYLHWPRYCTTHIVARRIG